MSDHPRFRLLQVYRGLAALWVFAYHLEVLRDGFGFMTSSLGRWFVTGPLAVDLFFVLTGFCAVYFQYGRFGTPSSAAAYIRNRFIRTIPTLFILNVAKTISVFLVDTPRCLAKRNLSTILSSFLLLPSDTYLIDAAWCMTYIWGFYLLVTIGILLGRKWFAIFCTLWASMIVLVNTLSCELTGPILGCLFSPRNIQFLLGGLFAHVARRYHVRVPRPKALLGCGVVLVLIGAHYYESIKLCPMLRFFGLGSAFSLVVLGTVTMELRKSISVPVIFERVGDASYSFYLAHSNVMMVVALVVMRPGFDVGGGWALGIIAVVSAAVSFAFWRFIEVPVIRYLRVHVIPRGRVKTAE